MKTAAQEKMPMMVASSGAIVVDAAAPSTLEANADKIDIEIFSSRCHLNRLSVGVLKLKQKAILGSYDMVAVPLRYSFCSCCCGCGRRRRTTGRRRAAVGPIDATPTTEFYARGLRKQPKFVDILMYRSSSRLLQRLTRWRDKKEKLAEKWREESIIHHPASIIHHRIGRIHHVAAAAQ